MKGLVSLILIANEHVSRARATGQERSGEARDAKGIRYGGDLALSVLATDIEHI